MSLSELYESMAAHDEDLVKQAQEHEKLAAEENAAGRIMARGFMDELHKLAGDQLGAMNEVKDAPLPLGAIKKKVEVPKVKPYVSAKPPVGTVKQGPVSMKPAGQ